MWPSRRILDEIAAECRFDNSECTEFEDLVARCRVEESRSEAEEVSLHESNLRLITTIGHLERRLSESKCLLRELDDNRERDLRDRKRKLSEVASQRSRTLLLCLGLFLCLSTCALFWSLIDVITTWALAQEIVTETLIFTLNSLVPLSLLSLSLSSLHLSISFSPYPSFRLSFSVCPGFWSATATKTLSFFLSFSPCLFLFLLLPFLEGKRDVGHGWRAESGGKTTEGGQCGQRGRQGN